LNWHLEGSNDKLNWTILDRRIYGMEEGPDNAMFEDEQKVLK
jgi:hypothetical protein